MSLLSLIIQAPFYLALLFSSCSKATLTKLIWSGSANNFTNFLLSLRTTLPTAMPGKRTPSFPEVKTLKALF